MPEKKAYGVSAAYFQETSASKEHRISLIRLRRFVVA